MADNNFDVVVCVGPHDFNIVNLSMCYTRKNVIGYRNIYLVSSDPNINIEGAITIDEKIFPFSKKDLIDQFGNNERNGWYLQQLLKFYSGLVIPGILERYLIIDSDTFFLNPTKFITDDGKHYITTGTEYHKPYFLHMNRLHYSLKKMHSSSGISHHSFFHTIRVKGLMTLVEDYFSNEKPFWKIFLDMIDPNEFMDSGASEYEIYFTYMHLYYPDEICVRELKWENCSRLGPDCVTKNDFVSIHWYSRK
jgi:hypothetical protein